MDDFGFSIEGNRAKPQMNTGMLAGFYYPGPFVLEEVPDRSSFITD